MSERVDLNKILKNCPKGWKFWSPLFGEVKFSSMDSDYVDVEIHNEEIWTFNTNATITFSNRESLELMLFPSKEQRDWSKFTAPWYKKERFDPNMLKAFDRVLVRNYTTDYWCCGFFSYISMFNGTPYKYVTENSAYWKCIPYNDDTKHLVGTKEEAPDFYRYWND